jgi:Mn2+/Fe2+ NRAMP family transporter
MSVGLGLIYAGFSVVEMLFWASVLNGLLAPPCILLVLLLTRNPKVMGAHVNSAWVSRLGWIGVLVTGAAALALAASFLT